MTGVEERVDFAILVRRETGLRKELRAEKMKNFYLRKKQDISLKVWVDDDFQ